MSDLANDRGFLLGDGVFDTLTAFNGVPFQGDRHLARLLDHAGQIGIPADEAEIREQWRRALAEAGEGACILRTTITRGHAERGLWPEMISQPTCVVSAAPWQPAYIQGTVSLVTASIRRNAFAPTARLKTLSYLDNILAAREAKQRSADDALLLNTDGAVACTTIANVFALRDRRLVTPPVADGVLAGTMRALVLELAGSDRLDVEERTMSLADLVVADVVFVTNSVRFLRPVASLDGKSWSGDLPAPFAALRDAVARCVRDQTGYSLNGR